MIQFFSKLRTTDLKLPPYLTLSTEFLTNFTLTVEKEGSRAMEFSYGEIGAKDIQKKQES